MAVLSDRACFIHVPKTGGRWVREAMTAAGIGWEEVGTYEPWHLSGNRSLFAFGASGEAARVMHSWPEQDTLGERHVFGFVRHPVDWLRSFHGHDGGRIAGGYLDNLRHRYPHFDDFAWHIAERDPGIVGEMFAKYLGDETAEVLSVGGLVRQLQIAGHEFDASTIAQTERVGVGKREPVGRGVFDKICTSEESFILRYGLGSDYETWAELQG